MARSIRVLAKSQPRQFDDDSWLRRSVLGCAALATLSAATPVPEGVLTVHVTNVRNAKGRVHVDVCPQANFLKDDCPYAGFAPSQPGVTTVVVRGVPAGRYAVQAFHDENSNGKVDRVIFGLPKEGVGFSNDAPIRMSPPKWNDAVFGFDGRAGTIQLKLRYFL